MAFATTSLASDSDSPLRRGFFDGTTPTRLGQIEPAPEHEGDHAHDDSGNDRSIDPFQRSADIVNLLIQRRKAGVHVVELLTSLGVLDVAHPLTSFQIANALEDRRAGVRVRRRASENPYQFPLASIPLPLENAHALHWFHD
jgi:hypothetical protein